MAHEPNEVCVVFRPAARECSAQRHFLPEIHISGEWQHANTRTCRLRGARPKGDVGVPIGGGGWDELSSTSAFSIYRCTLHCLIRLVSIACHLAGVLPGQCALSLPLLQQRRRFLGAAIPVPVPQLLLAKLPACTLSQYAAAKNDKDKHVLRCTVSQKRKGTHTHTRSAPKERDRGKKNGHDSLDGLLGPASQPDVLVSMCITMRLLALARRGKTRRPKHQKCDQPLPVSIMTRQA